MAQSFRVLIILGMIIPMTACGVKGRLHSPAQIEKIEAKKAAEAERKAREENIQSSHDASIQRSAPPSVTGNE